MINLPDASNRVSENANDVLSPLEPQRTPNIYIE